MGVLVVGYDGSECANAALDEAVALAKGLGDSIVIGFGYSPGGPGEEFQSTAGAIRDLGERLTAQATERAAAAGVEAKVELVAERAARALMALADEHDARAIVVGSYGESPIKGALLGSTPHKLLHISPRPVLVVPAPE